MNKLIISVMVCLLVSISSFLQAGGGAKYKPLAQRDQQRYYDDLEFEYRRAEEKFLDLFKIMEDGNSISPSLPLDITKAKEMLEIKKILVAEFRGKESLRSPLVRQKLLEILASDEIDQDMLEEFQDYVDAEKAQIKAFDNPK